MIPLFEIAAELERLAPLELAEAWDNVGLLLGDANSPVRRLMTCLTVSDVTAKEAILGQADLIVAHHPLPFHPLRRITTDSSPGRLLWDLIGSKISIYSPHTAWDSSEFGINQQTAVLLGLEGIEPIKPQAQGVRLQQAGSASVGVGRVGQLPNSLTSRQIVEHLAQYLPSIRACEVGLESRRHSRVGILCGSGGGLLELAASQNCDVVISGEATYHQCLAAEALGMTLILIGHHASERFAMDRMAQMLQAKFPTLTVWASRDERDPIANLFSS